MAEETKTETKSAAVDYAKKIGGTLTLAKAEEVFGKAHAIEAMKSFAVAGGHGQFDESELRAPLFGGLAMSPDTAQINAALNALEVK